MTVSVKTKKKPLSKILQCMKFVTSSNSIVHSVLMQSCSSGTHASRATCADMKSITESDNKGLREAPPRLELMMLRDLKCQDPSALHQLSITALQKSCTFATCSHGFLATP